jgi:hypothetical protein
MSHARKATPPKKSKHRGRPPGAKDRQPRKNKGRRQSVNQAAQSRLNGLKGGDPTLKGGVSSPAMDAVRVDLYSRRVESANEDLLLKRQARLEREGLLVTKESVLAWQRHLVASIRRVCDDLPAISAGIVGDPNQAAALAATMKECSRRIRERLANDPELLKDITS